MNVFNESYEQPSSMGRGIAKLSNMNKGLATTLLFVMTTTAQAQDTTLYDGLVNYWALDGTGEDSASSLPGNASTTNDDLEMGGDSGTVSITTSFGRFGGSANFERNFGNNGRLATS